MNSISDKLGVRILILIGFVYVSLFMGLGEAPLFDEDEGWYSLCALEMIQTGDWVTPRTGGKPFFQQAAVVLLGPGDLLQAAGM